jgi:cyclopropane-fatty-acyl-phospholipid synthase
MSTDERKRTAQQAGTQSVAGLFEPLLGVVLGGAPPVRFEFWDGSFAGPEEGPNVVKVQSPHALRRMIWSPGELGIGRAYVAGDLDVQGDVFTVLRTLQGAASNDAQLGIGAAVSALGVAAGSARSGCRCRPRPRRPASAATATPSNATPRPSATTTTWATTSTGCSSGPA